MREFRGKIPNTVDVEKYLFYFCKMKLFFELPHINPKEGDEALLQAAIDITRAWDQKDLISHNEHNAALAFFVKKFLEPGGRFYYEEEAEKGFAVLIEMLEEILEYIRAYVPEPQV